MKITKIITVIMFLSSGAAIAMDAKTADVNPPLSSPEAQAVEILRNAVGSDDILIRMDAIESIAICRCKELYPLIEKCLEDGFEATRFAAALAVGDLGYKPALGKVMGLFDNGSDNEKLAAAYALLKLGEKDNDYHKVIVEGIQKADGLTNANAAMIMGKLGSRKYVGLLKWALHNKSSEDKTKIQAIESLAMLGEKDMNSKAWALMISKRADDRVMGIITMYRIGNYDALNAIKTMLEDEVLEVRIIAAGRLAALRDDSGIDIIKGFFEKDVKGLNGEDRTRALVHALDAVRLSRSFELAKYLPLYLKGEEQTVQIHSAVGILCISNGI